MAALKVIPKEEFVDVFHSGNITRLSVCSCARALL
jgi:hypothetical protein